MKLMTQTAKKFRFGEHQNFRFTFNQQRETQNQTDKVSEQKASELVSKPSVRCFSGSPEQVLEWFSIISEPFFYEVISQIVSSHKVSSKHMLILRGSHGPVLKVVFYDIDRVEDACDTGTFVRCFGVKLTTDSLRAFHVRKASPTEISMLPRKSYLCKFAADSLTRSNTNKYNI